MGPFAHGQTVIRLRRKKILDPYSTEETLADWGDPDEMPLHGCGIAPLDSDEAAAVGADVARLSRNLYAEFGADIEPGDRIRDALGDEWNVEGESVDWENPYTGRRFGSVTRLRRIEEF